MKPNNFNSTEHIFLQFKGHIYLFFFINQLIKSVDTDVILNGANKVIRLIRRAVFFLWKLLGNSSFPWIFLPFFLRNPLPQNSFKLMCCRIRTFPDVFLGRPLQSMNRSKTHPVGMSCKIICIIPSLSLDSVSRSSSGY